MEWGAPPLYRTIDGVLATRRVVYLLRSRRRTFLSRTCKEMKNGKKSLGVEDTPFTVPNALSLGVDEPLQRCVSIFMFLFIHL